MLVLFCACMAAASVFDLARMIIPNQLILVLIAGFFVLAVSASWPASLIGLHVAMGAIVLMATFAAFALGWMGGGDAKLIAATALWFGPTGELWDYMFLASLFGGILTLMLLLARTCLSPTTGHVSVDRLLTSTSGVPYGVALGAAGLVVVSRFPQMQSLFDLV